MNTNDKPTNEEAAIAASAGDPVFLREQAEILLAENHQLRRELDKAKAVALQAWKDADAAVAAEVDRQVSEIIADPAREMAVLKASRGAVTSERDALQAERNSLRAQLAQARSRGDDKEIAEKERDAMCTQLAAAVDALKAARNVGAKAGESNE